MKNNKKNIISLYITLILGISIYILISFLVDTYIKNLFLLNIVMIIATILFVLFAYIMFKSELEIGNFECKNCKHLFKPEYKKALFAPHIGMTRFLKCPKCKEKHWDKMIIE